MEKREFARIQGLSKFFGYPLLSQERKKATDFKFGQGPSEQKPIKNWRKGSVVGESRDFPIFSGTPYYLRNAKSHGF